jgi:cell division septation protein DedD
MRELKPKLMMANTGRRRRGPGGGFWSFLTFVIVFLVGVYVGTKLDKFDLIGTEPAPVKQTKEENDNIKATVKYETSTEPVISGDVNPPDETTASTSEKFLSLDGKSISEELIKPSPELSINTNDKGSLSDSGLTSIDPAQISGETKTADTAPTAQPENTALETAKTEEIQSGKTPKRGYTLQVGAFADKAQAEKAVSEYRGKGFGAYTVQVENSKGETWNLVKVGKYSSIEQAWSQSALFKRTVGRDAYVETLGTKTVFNESWGKNE